MSEEDLGRRLPAMLTDAPMPPSTVDLGQAIKAGRRRRSARYVASGVAVLAVIVAVPIAVQSQRPQAPPLSLLPFSTPATVVNPTACSVEQMPPGFLTMNTDPTGQHLAGTFYESSAGDHGDPATHRPAIWKDGRMELIPLAPGQAGYVNAVNSSGIVVGRVIDNAGSSAFAFADGKMHALPEGRDATATAINQAGVIVGARRAGGDWIPVRWRSLSSPPEVLPIPVDAVGGSVTAVTSDGLAVGAVRYANRPGQAVISYAWPPEGAHYPIPSPEGVTYQLRGGSGDWIHGSYVEGRDELKDGALLYNVTTKEFRRFADFAIEGETSTTSAGWFVGRKDNARDQLFLTDGSAYVALPMPTGVRRVLLDGVSADGRVVTAHRTDEGRAGVVWRCR